MVEIVQGPRLNPWHCFSPKRHLLSFWKTAFVSAHYTFLESVCSPGWPQTGLALNPPASAFHFLGIQGMLPYRGLSLVIWKTHIKTINNFSTSLSTKMAKIRLTTHMETRILSYFLIACSLQRFQSTGRWLQGRAALRRDMTQEKWFMAWQAGSSMTSSSFLFLFHPGYKPMDWCHSYAG